MVGGMLYLAHRVKEAVVEKAKVYGVESPDTDDATHVSHANQNSQTLRRALKR